VNGERRERSRLPRTGWFRLERPLGVGKNARWVDGGDAFVAARGDLSADLDFANAEVVALQRWVEARMGVKSFDPRTRTVRLDRKSTFALIDDSAWDPSDRKAPGALYCLENVRAGLLEPGQWHLDRSAGRVYYLPMKGERLGECEVIVPWLEELVRIEGDAKKDRPVHDVRFEDITFSHNQWHFPPGQAGNRQGAVSVPGAVNLRLARSCAFERCSFERLGTYALVLEDGCRDVLVRGNRMTDLGGGGVRIWHGCNRNTVSDNEISRGGRIFYSAIGVLVGRASGTQIVHNHIHDFNYTGIGVGWTWGYAEGEAYGNIIEHNHIHAIGSGLLSDLGGVYHLGVAPGTRIRFNLIHDVRRRVYGGGCVYLDEGSSNVLVENNLLYDCDDGPFHLHYGRDNVIRNNILALGRGPQAYLTRGEAHSSFRFERNLVLATNGSLVRCAVSRPKGRWRADFDCNLYFASSPRRSFSGGSFAAWQRRGQDRASIFADPRFVAPQRGDFRLKRGSPARKIGFVEFDVSGAGPREEFARREP
jgi:parallel beta-helix repeat protein